MQRPESTKLVFRAWMVALSTPTRWNLSACLSLFSSLARPSLTVLAVLAAVSDRPGQGWMETAFNCIIQTSRQVLQWRRRKQDMQGARGIWGLKGELSTLVRSPAHSPHRETRFSVCARMGRTHDSRLMLHNRRFTLLSNVGAMIDFALPI